ncbi:neugrin [Tiliqua scincoides]|uniref:neugrin n=1 Tax=Tiliqua scincoides TaxID=71010 RepID=UPI00346265BD
MAARRTLGLLRAARLAAGGAAAEEGEVERTLRRRQEAAARLRRLQRMLEPRGPPERTLSRQAMEQIRHLSREFPEDWPVSRLARGFRVQPDVVRRVLRSRFSPSSERSAKQDGRVWAAQSGGPPPAPGSRQPPALLTRESAFKLLPAGSRRLGVPPLAAPQADPAPVALPGEGAGEGHAGPRGASPPGSGSQWGEDPGHERFLSKEEMEQLAAEGWQSRLRVVQRGREFFDGDGNLLYRIPAAPPGD